MISNHNINSGSLRRFVLIFFKIMYHKTIIRFGFCDILNNQGRGKCYQPRTSARLITLTSTLITPDITKTSSNNYLISCHRATVYLTPDIFQVHCYNISVRLSPRCSTTDFYFRVGFFFIGDIRIALWTY